MYRNYEIRNVINYLQNCSHVSTDRTIVFFELKRKTEIIKEKMKNIVLIYYMIETK